MQKNIDEIYAFVADNEGTEGIIAAIDTRTKHMIPLVFSDIRHTDFIRQLAQETAKVSGKEVRLIKFSQRDVLEVIKTGSGNEAG